MSVLCLSRNQTLVLWNVKVYLAIFAVLLSISVTGVKGVSCLSPFSDFDVDADVQRVAVRDDRLFLVPSMNFSCAGRISAWTLALQPTNSPTLAPVASLDLQIWGRDGSGCLVLKASVIFFQLAPRNDEIMRIELTDEIYLLDFTPGDFVGFFVYEHGLSPVTDPASTNMTIQRFRRTEIICNVSISVEDERVQSPMISLQMETLLAGDVLSTPTVSAGSAPSSSPAASLGVFTPLTLSLVAALGAVGLAVVGLLGCLLVLLPLLLLQRRKIRTRDAATAAAATKEPESPSPLVADTPANKQSFSIPHQSQNVDKQWTVDWKYIQVGEKLVDDRHDNEAEDGSHSNEVCQGYMSRQGIPRALKHLSIKDTRIPVLLKMVRNDSAAAQNSFWNELRLLQQLSSPLSCSPHVVKLLGYLPAHPSTVVIEYSLHGNLLGFLQSYKPGQLAVESCAQSKGALLPGLKASNSTSTSTATTTTTAAVAATTTPATAVPPSPRDRYQAVTDSRSTVNVTSTSWREEGTEGEDEGPCYAKPQLNLRQLRQQHQQQQQQGCDDDDVYAEPYALLAGIQEKDLMSFAQQIAGGMEYLSGMGIVHRDLACRNILVSTGKVLKIAEFGLARTTDVYVSAHSQSTWLKWTSPEALRNRVFTEKSDVWSYGVCLWEICTLGREPYPTIRGSDLLASLTAGHRLGQPRNCSEEVYKLMMDCWSLKPGQRPLFSALHSYLYHLIEQNSSGSGYIKLRTSSQHSTSSHQYDQICN